MLSLSSSTTLVSISNKICNTQQKEGLLVLLEDNKNWNDVSLFIITN